jgi:hypothetical protein
MTKGRRQWAAGSGAPKVMVSNMDLSPIEFTKEFCRLRGCLLSTEVPDQQLGLLIDFWPSLQSMSARVGSGGFFEEYADLIHPRLTEQILLDYRPDELRRILTVIDDLSRTCRHEVLIKKVLVGRKQVIRRLGVILLYVGDLKNALSVLSDLVDEKPDIDLDGTDLSQLEPYQALRKIINERLVRSVDFEKILQDILIGWTAKLESFHRDRVTCLFVEKSNAGSIGRGRLRTLHGSIDLCHNTKASGKLSDEVTIDNNFTRPNDPFVGVGYDSLAAVRSLLFTLKISKRSGDSSYRAFYSILNAPSYKFTGDSIGLAMALLTYTHLHNHLVLSSQRFIPSRLAVTGGVDADGNVLPVNKESLRLKIERAFYSSIDRIAAPEECLAEACSYRDELQRDYPRRQLEIVGHATLSSLVLDRKISIVRKKPWWLVTYSVVKPYFGNRLVLAATLLCFAILYFSFAPRQDESIAIFPQTVLEGCMTDEHQNPIRGAMVTVDGYNVEGITKADGCFRVTLRDVAIKEIITVRVYHPEYVSYSTDVIGAEEIEKIELSLRSR